MRGSGRRKRGKRAYAIPSSCKPKMHFISTVRSRKTDNSGISDFSNAANFYAKPVDAYRPVEVGPSD